MDPTYLAELFGVENKVVVITGGGGILCGAISKGLARLGARIAVLDLRLDAAQAVADEIAAAGGIAKAFCADVLSKASLESCAEQVLDHFGRVDVLINGAGEQC